MTKYEYAELFMTMFIFLTMFNVWLGMTRKDKFEEQEKKEKE